jgi:SAM-dependent methyltransferase
MLGGYQKLDGTLEFYGRVGAILRPTDTVLDLGAGRGAWFFEDKCETRRRVRDLKPKVACLIGADVDPVVLANPTTTKNVLIVDGRIPVAEQSVDVVVADYVLEHIQDPGAFAAEIGRVLRPGGYLCARTPHKYHYVSIAARLVRNRRHKDVLAHVQPDRKAVDVFPTAYRLNTLGALRRAFAGFSCFNYLYAGEPQYYFGRASLYRFLELVHSVAPAALVSNLFVFMRKPLAPADAASAG